MSLHAIRPWRMIDRRPSRRIMVGNVPVGGGAPISVQTMTNTLTTDVAGTVAQVVAAAEAGRGHRPRVHPDEESTRALREIVRQSPVPIVADIHFHYSPRHRGGRGRRRVPADQPGNIGSAERVREVVKAARDHGCSIRIGVNAGSLERHLLEQYGEPCPEAMVQSGLDHIKLLQDLDFPRVQDQRQGVGRVPGGGAYQQIAEVTDAPIHLGITEAGGLMTGTVKSAVGLGQLLWMGIGDTIRVSLSADPVEEVKVGFEILKALGLRHRGVNIISCPSCARQGFDVIRTVEALEQRLSHIKTPMSLSIIGCVVNGPARR
jgi:(E)-4-hydroxy-3-methylbut-2-enyl-diphosphate synthase